MYARSQSQKSGSLSFGYVQRWNVPIDQMAVDVSVGHAGWWDQYKRPSPHTLSPFTPVQSGPVVRALSSTFNPTPSLKLPIPLLFPLYPPVPLFPYFNPLSHLGPKTQLDIFFIRYL